MKNYILAFILFILFIFFNASIGNGTFNYINWEISSRIAFGIIIFAYIFTIFVLSLFGINISIDIKNVCFWSIMFSLLLYLIVTLITFDINFHNWDISCKEIVWASSEFVFLILSAVDIHFRIEE